MKRWHDGGSCNRGSAQRGFTLLEVIIAFALLALGLTLLLGSLSRATQQVRWSADAGRAALHAQSLLDQLGVERVLAPGQQQGSFEEGRYRWTLDVQAWHDPSAQASAAMPVENRQHLLQLELNVRWGEGSPRQRLQLHSLRLVSAGPGPATPP